MEFSTLALREENMEDASEEAVALTVTVLLVVLLVEVRERVVVVDWMLMET
jgi:hypothetical protein